MANTLISKIIFSAEALKDYKNLKHQKKTGDISTIWKLIRDIDINGNLCGIGNPERLRIDEEFSGWFSRRINNEDRLVYLHMNDLKIIIIKRCATHYGKQHKN